MNSLFNLFSIVKWNSCSDCNKGKWCVKCNRKRFQQGFSNWTSGNELVDKFIQETQLNGFEVLEWISYCKLKNIEVLEKGRSSTMYKAIWSDGPISNWCNYERKWIRYNNEMI